MAKRNSEKLSKLNWLLYVAVILLLVVSAIYYFQINNEASNTKANWGAFGDFVGGTLNPIFALFSLFAIIYTIKIQTQELEFSREELKATKEELEKSRIAQEEQSASFKLQNESIKLQTFENTFFQLQNLFVETRENINYVSTHISFDGTKRTEYRALEFIRLLLGELKQQDIDYEKVNEEYESYTGVYFGQIYQVLKFIDTSKISNKQGYVDIFRAQFSKEELELLFCHGLGNIGIRKFKSLIERYEFFEHIILNDEIESKILKYNISVFGDNSSHISDYRSKLGALNKYNNLEFKFTPCE